VKVHESVVGVQATAGEISISGKLSALLEVGSGFHPELTGIENIYLSGTILGMVKDGTGAVMPGTTVTLLNTGTGLTRTVVTDTKGEYTAPSLPTGTYSITSEVSGFKKVSLANVRLGVDQKVRIDLTLELGQMTEAVEIQAETALVQNASSDLSDTVNEVQIKTLPLNGRNFVSLTRTIPGVLRGIPGANIDGAGSIAWRASAAFSANGARPTTPAKLPQWYPPWKAWRLQPFRLVG
jgi:hypothetical protein